MSNPANNRRARTHTWLTTRQYQWWGNRGPWSNYVYFTQQMLIERPARWLLCRLFGHEAAVPEGDHCRWCERAMAQPEVS